MSPLYVLIISKSGMQGPIHRLKGERIFPIFLVFMGFEGEVCLTEAPFIERFMQVLHLGRKFCMPAPLERSSRSVISY